MSSLLGRSALCLLFILSFSSYSLATKVPHVRNAQTPGETTSENRSMFKLNNRQLGQCKSNSDCSNGYSCLGFPSIGGCKSKDIFCVCASKSLYCSKSSPCGSDNVCAALKGDSTGICVSCKVFEDSKNVVAIGDNPCDSEVCVDAKLLSHLPAHHLVFQSHRRASVLCDQYDSCATSGHIVTFNGKPMMMKAYCEQVGNCSYKVMHVNSPKMKRGLRVASKTKGLLFTPFSAKYQSKIEEHVLSALIRAGI